MVPGKRPPQIYGDFSSTTLTQDLSLRQIVTWLLRTDRLALVIGLAALVLAYVGFSQYRGAGQAEAELAALEKRFRVAEDDLAYLLANDDTPTLKQNLEAERSMPESQTLPSRSEASDFSGAIVEYAAIKGLPLTTFDRTDTSVAISGKEFPSLRHSVEAQGPGATLEGLLQLVNEFPTAKVLELNLTRVAQARSQWAMALELDVFYRR